MKLPSLRSRMLVRVMLPLALTWLLGSIVAVSVANVYTRKAFDRSLLDDAYAIAANVSVNNGSLSFNLSPREVGAVLFDQSEREFFAVLREDGSLVAGQGGLRETLADAAEPYVFEERHYRGLDLRMVTLWRPQPLPHAVVVAQTTRSRSHLGAQLLGASVVPQAGLLLLVGLWLRRSIGLELEPLSRLEEALERRDANDLTPVNLAPQTRDIAHLADAFNALMARIGQAVRAQREFAGNVAHELRQPLAGIRSLAEHGLAQTDPAAWSAQLRSIVASEQRASHLIEQLLAMALADEAREDLQLQPLPLDAVVRDVLLRRMPRADSLGVDLGAEGLDRPVWVRGTVALVEGLLSNLVDNALHYGRPVPGGGQPRVTVAAARQGNQVVLTVTDNGPGMDDSQRQRVVARWEQGPSGLREGGGAGLGLAIVSRYAELMRGHMALEPAPDGAGLRVSVWLDPAPAPR
jgi:two-component system sensor histidine kinase TctE